MAVSAQEACYMLYGEPCAARTHDTLLKRQVLFH